MKATHHISFMTQELEWRTRRQAMHVVKERLEDRQIAAMDMAKKVRWNGIMFICYTKKYVLGGGESSKSFTLIVTCYHLSLYCVSTPSLLRLWRIWHDDAHDDSHDDSHNSL